MRERREFKDTALQMMIDLLYGSTAWIESDLRLEINARLRNPLQAPLIAVTSMIEVYL